MFCGVGGFSQACRKDAAEQTDHRQVGCEQVDREPSWQKEMTPGRCQISPLIGLIRLSSASGPQLFARVAVAVRCSG